MTTKRRPTAHAKAVRDYQQSMSDYNLVLKKDGRSNDLHLVLQQGLLLTQLAQRSGQIETMKAWLDRTEKALVKGGAQ